VLGVWVVPNPNMKSDEKGLLMIVYMILVLVGYTAQVRDYQNVLDQAPHSPAGDRILLIGFGISVIAGCVTTYCVNEITGSREDCILAFFVTVLVGYMIAIIVEGRKMHANLKEEATPAHIKTALLKGETQSDSDSEIDQDHFENEQKMLEIVRSQRMRLEAFSTSPAASWIQQPSMRCVYLFANIFVGGLFLAWTWNFLHAIWSEEVMKILGDKSILWSTAMVVSVFISGILNLNVPDWARDRCQVTGKGEHKMSWDWLSPATWEWMICENGLVTRTFTAEADNSAGEQHIEGVWHEHHWFMTTNAITVQGRTGLVTIQPCCAVVKVNMPMVGLAERIVNDGDLTPTVRDLLSLTTPYSPTVRDLDTDRRLVIKSGRKIEVKFLCHCTSKHQHVVECAEQAAAKRAASKRGSTLFAARRGSTRFSPR